MNLTWRQIYINLLKKTLTEPNKKMNPIQYDGSNVIV